MTFTEIIDLAMGGAGALFILIAGIVFAYKFFTNKVFPLVEKAITQHLAQVEKIIESHNEDRETWREGMQELSGVIKEVTKEMSTARTEVIKVQERVDAVHKDVDRVDKSVNRITADVIKIKGIMKAEFSPELPNPEVG